MGERESVCVCVCERERERERENESKKEREVKTKEKRVLERLRFIVKISARLKDRSGSFKS